jgi:hypothetical protein
MKKIFLCGIIALVAFVSCENNSNKYNSDNTIVRTKMMSPQSVNIGYLHNVGLDILLEAITPLYKNEETDFNAYTIAFAKSIDNLVQLYGYDENFNSQKYYDDICGLSTQEDVSKYMEEMKHNLWKHSEPIGKAYYEFTLKLEEILNKNEVEDTNKTSNDIEHLCDHIFAKYTDSCKTDAERLSLKALVEVGFYSYKYWSNPIKMETWNKVIQYSKKDKKDKKDKKKPKPDKDKDKDKDKGKDDGGVEGTMVKIARYVAADALGAAAGASVGSFFPFFGTVGGAIILGTLSSGMEASNWD